MLLPGCEESRKEDALYRTSILVMRIIFHVFGKSVRTFYVFNSIGVCLVYVFQSWLIEYYYLSLCLLWGKLRVLMQIIIVQLSVMRTRMTVRTKILLNLCLFVTVKASEMKMALYRSSMLVIRMIIQMLLKCLKNFHVFAILSLSCSCIALLAYCITYFLL